MTAALDWDAIAARIAQAMTARGLSGRALAAELDMPHSRLGQFLVRFHQKLEIDGLFAIARHLGIDPGELIGIEGKSPATVPLSALHAHPENPRRDMDGDSLVDLARSIERDGLLVPLIVKPFGANPGAFMVIAGHRRLAAMNMLAEDDEIADDYPVKVSIIAPQDDVDDLLAQLVENLAREAMHPLDEGAAFRRLQDAGMATAEMAARIGITQRLVQSRIQLTKKLSAEAIMMFREGALSLAQAEALMRYGPDIQEAFLARHVTLEGWTEKEVHDSLDDTADALVAPRPEPESTHERRSPPPPSTIEIAGPAETPRDPAGPADLTRLIKADDRRHQVSDDEGAGEGDDGEGDDEEPGQEIARGEAEIALTEEEAQAITTTARVLIRAYDAAVMRCAAPEVAALFEAADALSILLHGGTQFGVADAQDRLAQATRADDGITPLHGQSGRFEMDAFGCRIDVEIEGLFSYSPRSATLTAIDWDLPFISPTGYRSHYVNAVPVHGEDVATWVRRALEAELPTSINGGRKTTKVKLVEIEAVRRPKGESA